MKSLFSPDEGSPTNRNYHIKCRIFIKNIGYDDQQSRGSHGNCEAQMVFLEPEDSTESWSFLNAWCPESESENVECSCIGDRVGRFRAAVRRPDRRHGKPHLFVMTVDAEEAIKSYNQHQRQNFPNDIPTLKVTVLAEEDDEVFES